LWEQSQIESIVEKINADGRMQVLSYNVDVKNSWYSDLVSFQVKVLQNPFPVLILVMAIGAIGTSLFVYLSLNKIFLISREVPQAMTGITSTVSLGLIAVITIAIIYGIKIFKG
jgi:hypothetical protein